MQIFFLGFLAAFNVFSFLRIIGAKFPINVVSPFILGITFLGIPIGAFYFKKVLQSHKKSELIFSALFVVFLLSNVFTQDVTVHFLLGNAYYPYLKPSYAVLHIGALVISIFLSAVVLIFLSAKFAEHFSKSENPTVVYAYYILGQAFGYVIAYFTILRTGAFPAICIGVVGTLFLFRDKKIILITSLIVAIIFAYSLGKKGLFFLWQVKEYKLVDSFWTPYYKVDFISFNNDKCLGGVYNMLMTWYVCDDVSLFPQQVREIQKAIAEEEDIKRALSAGRPDGVYAFSLINYLQNTKFKMQNQGTKAQRHLSASQMRQAGKGTKKLSIVDCRLSIENPNNQPVCVHRTGRQPTTNNYFQNTEHGTQNPEAVDNQHVAGRDAQFGRLYNRKSPNYQIIKSPNYQITKSPLQITILDYDPVIIHKIKKHYSKYNANILNKPFVKIKTGDIRYFIEQEQSKYDLIYFDGIGIRLFFLPRSIVPQEDYLLTKESYNRIFDKLLTQDGLLLLDWGSSQEKELYPMVMNLPKGVHFKGFWTIFSEYPLSGLPLFFVMASRDEEKLERISDKMLASGIFKEILVNKRKSNYNYRYSDNSPFLQGFILWPPLSLPFAAVFAGIVILIISYLKNNRQYLVIQQDVPDTLSQHLVRECLFCHYEHFLLSLRAFFRLSLRAKRSNLKPLNKGSSYETRTSKVCSWTACQATAAIPFYFLIIGIGSGFLEAFILSRFTRFFPRGVPFGFLMVSSCFLIGAAVPNIFLYKIKRQNIMLLLSMPILFYLLDRTQKIGYGQGLENFIILITAIFAVGFIASLFWVYGIRYAGQEQRVLMFSIEKAAEVLGLYLFQWFIFLLGYYITLLIICGLYLLALIVRKCSLNTVAEL